MIGDSNIVLNGLYLLQTSPRRREARAFLMTILAPLVGLLVDHTHTIDEITDYVPSEGGSGFSYFPSGWS